MTHRLWGSTPYEELAKTAKVVLTDSAQMEKTLELVETLVDFIAKSFAAYADDVFCLGKRQR